MRRSKDGFADDICSFLLFVCLFLIVIASHQQDQFQPVWNCLVMKGTTFKCVCVCSAGNCAVNFYRRHCECLRTAKCLTFQWVQNNTSLGGICVVFMTLLQFKVGGKRASIEYETNFTSLRRNETLFTRVISF